jgi:hypothetical protein
LSCPQKTSLATILAAALADLFPDAVLINFFATDKGFFCDFSLPFPFEKRFLPILEERMGFCVKKQLAFIEMEMVPSNAAQLLQERGVNSYMVNKVLAKSNLVTLIRLDHFVGVSPGSHLPTTGDVPPWKLVRGFQYDGWIRLFGVAGSSKEELKEFVKTKPSDESHLGLVEKLQLFKPYHFFSSVKGDGTGWCSLPLGESLKKNLITFVGRHFSDVDLIATHALDPQSLMLFHADYVERTGRKSWEILKIPLDGDGLELLTSSVGFCDTLFFLSDEKEISVFLQNIVSLLKIFCFDFRVVAVGKISKALKKSLEQAGIENLLQKGPSPLVEFQIADSLGRYWTGPRVWHEEREKFIRSSLFYSLERFVALLLESKKSRLLYELIGKGCL